MAADEKKRHRFEAQEWCFRLMNILSNLKNGLQLAFLE
jgi:hypothetical protein